MEYTPDWELIIILNDNAASEIYEFTKENLKQVIQFVDANGNSLSSLSSRVTESFSSPFVITGIESEEVAINAKSNILNIIGGCGVIKINEPVSIDF